MAASRRLNEPSAAAGLRLQGCQRYFWCELRRHLGISVSSGLEKSREDGSKANLSRAQRAEMVVWRVFLGYHMTTSWSASHQWRTGGPSL